MHGFLVAVGAAARNLDEERISGIWPIKSRHEVISPRPDIRIARFSPEEAVPSLGFVWSDDRQVLVYVSGYLYTHDAPRHASLADQVKTFAETCRKNGYESALRSIGGGTFLLLVVDLARSSYYVTTDHIGALSLYHSPVEGGWLLSTNPVALARSGAIDLRPDFTAMAEWAYIGYTMGDRFLLKGIRIVPPYTSFRWDPAGSEGHFEENPDSPWNILPAAPGPSPEEVTDAFIASCRRIAVFDPKPVNLQSAGLDSRFILASWPEGYNPTCYTYGDIDSREVGIARAVAKQRGSRWIHVWLDGDDVAPDLGELFTRTGLIIFPDRLVAARRIRKDGFAGVLDGYLGGVFNGAGYLDCDRYFSHRAKLGRFLTVFVDQRVSELSRDRIAEAILDSILEIRDEAALREFVDRDFVDRLRAEWPNILQDLRLQVDRYTPPDDSLATLWNNLVLANRSAHAIIQQKVIMRSFVEVYCPFSGDLELHRMLRRIPHEAAAHNRFYFRMYRLRFPQYLKIPYGATLVPLNRSPFLHKWSSILISKGGYIPFLGENPKGRERDANSWHKWISQSGLVRETALAFLREGGILDPGNASKTFDAIQKGGKRGSGKVFHLATVAKWIAMSVA